MTILPETLEKLAKVNSVPSRYALEIIDYIDRNNSLPDLFNNGPIDTVAMCAVICPEIIKTQEISVLIDTSDNQRRWKRRRASHRRSRPDARFPLPWE